MISIKVLALVASLPILAVLAVFSFFRLPGGQMLSFRKEIRYQVMDFGQMDSERYGFEELLKNRRIFVVNSERKHEWFYVTEEDFRKLWPESWGDMERKNYTIEATFSVRPLLLSNGYTVALVTDITRLNKQPYVTK